MKMAIIGDIHISLRKNREWEESRFSSLIQTLKSKNYDKIVFAGDIFDSPKPSLEEVRLFYTEIIPIKDKLWVIHGNHEQLGKGAYTFNFLPEMGYTLMDNEIFHPSKGVNIYFVGHGDIKSITDIDLLEGKNILISHIRCNIGMVKEEVRLSPISKMFDYVILGDIHQRYKPFENVEYTSQPYTNTYGAEKDTGYLELDTSSNSYSLNYVKLNIPNKIKLVTSSDKYLDVIKTLPKDNLYKIVVTGSISDVEGIQNSLNNVLLEKEIVNQEEDLESHLENIKNSGIIDFESKLLELTRTGYSLEKSHLDKGKELLKEIFAKVNN